MAVNALIAIVLGAAMSMLLRAQVPLVIFFWSFVPTLAAFLAISSGDSLVSGLEFGPATGSVAIWAGNMLLAIAVAGVYWRLRRN